MREPLQLRALLLRLEADGDLSLDLRGVPEGRSLRERRSGKSLRLRNSDGPVKGSPREGDL